MPAPAEPTPREDATATRAARRPPPAGACLSVGVGALPVAHFVLPAGLQRQQHLALGDAHQLRRGRGDRMHGRLRVHLYRVLRWRRSAVSVHHSHRAHPGGARLLRRRRHGHLRQLEVHCLGLALLRVVLPLKQVADVQPAWRGTGPLVSRGQGGPRPSAGQAAVRSMCRGACAAASMCA